MSFKRGRGLVMPSSISLRAVKGFSSTALRNSDAITTIHTARAKNKAPAQIHPAVTFLPMKLMKARESTPIHIRHEAASRIRIREGRYLLINKHKISTRRTDAKVGTSTRSRRGHLRSECERVLGFSAISRGHHSNAAPGRKHSGADLQFFHHHLMALSVDEQGHLRS